MPRISRTFCPANIAAVVFVLFGFLAPLDVRAQLDPSQLAGIVEALSHDSAAGRPTPGRELDKAAQYIAARLRAAGADALGDDGGMLQRYPVIETVLSQDSARIEIGSLTTWRFGKDFFYAAGGGSDPEGVLGGPTVIVSGRVTSENSASLGVAEKVVIFLSPLTPRGAPEDFRSAFGLGGAGARAVILPGGRPDSLWKRLGAEPDEHKPSFAAAWPTWTHPGAVAVGAPRFRPVLELWAGRWQQLVAAARLDTVSLRSSDGSVKVTPVAAGATLTFARKIERVSWPSNVVAILPGSDPALRHEHVILTAHYDGLGRAKGGPPGPQSILNGADDNASGVAALIQVAQAIASGPRPRRSIIFAAVSGEENGLWGSDFLAMRPPVPRTSIVANVNMDMIGRSSGDSVFITGRHDTWLGPIANRAIARGARGLVLLDESALERRFPGQRANERSDHANFRRRGIPPIAFFTGWHADYHETTDDAAKVNYDALSRIAGLVRDLTLEIANSSR